MPIWLHGTMKLSNWEPIWSDVIRLRASIRPSTSPDTTPNRGDHHRLDQEGCRDHVLLEANSPEHADLLATFDDGAEGDHPEGRDTDEQDRVP